MKSAFFLVFALLSSPAALPADLLDLHAGAAAVADQSAAERARAMPLALAQVLGKLSGLQSFEDRPEVSLALDRARDLVVSFYYRNLSILLPDGTESEQLELVVHFARSAVDELHRSLQLPVWKPQRRPLTPWLVVEDEFGRRVMPIELEYAWQGTMRAAADRGLPVRRPEPDADGLYPVDVQLLWGGFTEELDAGQGPADAFVMAALREGPVWNVRMNLDYGGQRWSWRERGGELETILVAGMHRAVSEIAATASIAATDLGRWRHEIGVTGLTGAGDYARCLAYLQDLSLVEHVRVSAAAPGRVRFGLELNALPDYLDRSLQQDGVLVHAGDGNEYVLIPREAPGDVPEAAGRDGLPVPGTTGPDGAELGRE